jgi:mono/diheme cytochrome c family protein
MPWHLAIAAAAALPDGGGARLVLEAGCASCHASIEALQEPLDPPMRLDLIEHAPHLAPDWVERFLLAPELVRPGSRMPDCLPADAAARAAEAHALAHFLCVDGTAAAAAPAAVLPEAVEHGRQLFHRIGCVACHAPQALPEELELPFWELDTDSAERDPELGALATDALPSDVPLAGLASKWDLFGLARYLEDPLRDRPDGRMPSFGLDASEATDLAAWLLREQAAGSARELAESPGLAWAYFEGDYPGDVFEPGDATPLRAGAAADLSELPPHREDDYAFVFSGFVTVPRDGRWTFWTQSDDGSRLFVDGELVVENDGQHGFDSAAGQVELSAGRHALRITYFEHRGDDDLAVRWAGPGQAEQELPAAALSHAALEYRAPQSAPLVRDEALFARGAELFQSRGCAACHRAYGASPPAPALVELALVDSLGCIAESPRAGLPRYALTPDERGDLARAIADPEALWRPREPAAVLDDALGTLRCTACHERGPGTGVAAPRREYFVCTESSDDLGDPGRIPPPLVRAGGKLHAAWIARVLTEGARVRPYMAARMPQFGAARVGHLPALFEQADELPGDRDAAPFSTEAVAAGQRLAGKGGLSCIQCHNFQGYRGIGVPAVDLATVSERLKPGWFRQLLLDPVSLSMNSRMPEFWSRGTSPVTDLYGGDPGRQIDALWTFLSLGSAAPLPEGLVIPDSEYEIVPTDEPRLVSVFLEGASPRSVLVGFPERIHYAFDVQSSRLALAWRGRFFNARGTWEGRAGKLERPPSDDVLALAAGPCVVAPETDGGPSEPRALGHGWDEERRPVWRWAIGAVEVEERLRPALDASGTHLVHEVELVSPAAASGLAFRGFDGRVSPLRFEADAAGAWRAVAREEIRW